MCLASLSSETWEYFLILKIFSFAEIEILAKLLYFVVAHAHTLCYDSN